MFLRLKILQIKQKAYILISILFSNIFVNYSIPVQQTSTGGAAASTISSYSSITSQQRSVGVTTDSLPSYSSIKSLSSSISAIVNLEKLPLTSLPKASTTATKSGSCLFKKLLTASIT